MSQDMWPQGGHRPAPRPPAKPEFALPPAVAFEPVGGTPFGVAIVSVAPTSSGPATASLVTGVGSILVSLAVACFAAIGASRDAGPIAAGAFAVLAVLLGVAALVLGRVGVRQVRRRAGWSTVTGRGLAIAGMICGGVGLLISVLSVLAALLVVTT